MSTSRTEIEFIHFHGSGLHVSSFRDDNYGRYYWYFIYQTFDLRRSKFLRDMQYTSWTLVMIILASTMAIQLGFITCGQCTSVDHQMYTANRNMQWVRRAIMETHLHPHLSTLSLRRKKYQGEERVSTVLKEQLVRY